MTLRLKLATGLAAAILCASAGGAFAAAATTLDNDTNVMSGPSSNTKLIGTLQAGENVAITRMSKDWCRISTPAVGWISCSDINNLPAARTNAAPTTTPNPAYSYDSDPVMGPHGGFHSVYNGESQ